MAEWKTDDKTGNLYRNILDVIDPITREVLLIQFCAKEMPELFKVLTGFDPADLGKQVEKSTNKKRKM